MEVEEAKQKVCKVEALIHPVTFEIIEHEIMCRGPVCMHWRSSWDYTQYSKSDGYCVKSV